MRFSQRIGKTSVRESLQLESIDVNLENRLWNTILNSFFKKIDNEPSYINESGRAQICRLIWTEFFGYRTDEIHTLSDGRVSTKGFIAFLKDWFFRSAWYEKYDFIEFISSIDKRVLHIDFIKECNSSLEREMSGYRVVDENIVQITSEEEITAIEDAIINSSKWQSVYTHIKTSIDYFANRENPDYRNSIKEAISAVEALCIIITGDKRATLGTALLQVEQKYQIHKALKSAFSSLYGYSSDSGGIRHSLLEDDIPVSMEDAKFMLVSCSAFINYLRVKVDK